MKALIAQESGGMRDLVVKALEANGFTVQDELRLPTNTGLQIKLFPKGNVTIYDTGKIVPGGPPDIKSKLQKIIQNIEQAPCNGPNYSRDVFVVYGHDENARHQLELLLHRWNLSPLILDQLPSEGKTIIEKLEKYQNKAGYCIVLATPDDEGFKAGQPETKKFRVRQNVVLELGMMFAKLGRDRVAILLKQVDFMEKPSDIDGILYIPFKDDVSDARILLAKELNAKGYKIDVSQL